MKLQKALLLSCASLFLFGFFACNRTNTECDKLWLLENPDNQKVEFRNEGLYLEIEKPEAERAIILRQIDLPGNFVAFLNFEDFERDVNGTYMRFFVRIPGQESVASAVITDDSPAGLGLQLGAVVDLSDSLGFGDSSEYVAAGIGKGQFSLYREGTFITVTAMDDDGNFVEETISFGGEDLEIGIEMGSTQDLSGSNAKTSVLIKSFTISTLAVGGVPSRVESDDFECYSIIE